MDDGRRTTDDRRQTMDDGRRTTDKGQRTVNNGQRTTGGERRSSVSPQSRSVNLSVCLSVRFLELKNKKLTDRQICRRQIDRSSPVRTSGKILSEMQNDRSTVPAGTQTANSVDLSICRVLILNLQKSDRSTDRQIDRSTLRGHASLAEPTYIITKVQVEVLG